MKESQEAPIPESVRRFIIEYIYSVETLEILLMLFSRDIELTAAEVSQQLYTSENSVAARLEELRVAKLLLATETVPLKYRFDSKNRESGIVRDLEQVYRERRVSIISFIYSKPTPTDPLRAFSDAFRLRKDDSKEES